MKRSFYLILTLLFCTYFLAYSLFMIMFQAFQDDPINYISILINGGGASFIFVLFYGLLMYFEMKPKINFLYSDTLSVPQFGSKAQVDFQIPNLQSSFQEVVELIKSGHKIDFLDENKRIIKFHSAFSIQQWQMGSVIYADAENERLVLVTFPFTGGFSAKASRKSAQLCDQLKSEIMSQLGNKIAK